MHPLTHIFIHHDARMHGTHTARMFRLPNPSSEYPYALYAGLARTVYDRILCPEPYMTAYYVPVVNTVLTPIYRASTITS